MPLPTRLCLALCLALATCDGADPQTPSARAGQGADEGEPAPDRLAVAGARPSQPDSAPTRKIMPRAKQAFTTIAALVEAEYIDGPIGEDALYTAAIEGVLARLGNLEGHPANTLMAPDELAELVIGTKGRLLGIGIMIERVADVVVINDVIPDGPAARAGLARGDRILAIDGTRVRELDMTAIVARIRGAEGTSVELFLQRDTEEWTSKIARGQVQVASVQRGDLGDGTGYLRITSFAKDTATELDAALAELRDAKVTKLVLDLRDWPGGLLETTVEIAERFLPPGKTVLTLENRAGKAEILATATAHAPIPRIAALIGPNTASSAEILADALREHGDVALVGETTLGKHTVESIHELDAGWAVKLSVRRFVTASGLTGDGKGVRPDIRIAADPDRRPARPTELTPDDDAALAAAMELLDR